MGGKADGRSAAPYVTRMQLSKLQKAAVVATLLFMLGWQVSRHLPGFAQEDRAVARAEAGDVAPDLRRFKLVANQPVAANPDPNSCRIAYFFDPDCPACGVASRYWKDTNVTLPVAVMWVAVGGTEPAIREYVERTGVAFPVYRVPDGMRRLGVTSIPAYWGILSDTIRIVETGALLSGPDTMSSSLSGWCSQTEDIE